MSSGRSRHPRARSTTLAAAVAAVSAVAFPGGVAHASVQSPAVVDFNGDGHADLAVGAPGGIISGQTGAGYVSVVYGATGGVNAARHKSFSQNTAGVPGAAEKGDGFGTHVAPVDLNHDGYTDLLVGAPGEDVGTVADAGMITVLWGGAQGLSSATAINTGARAGTHVGRVFTTGDFDGDGRTDIATTAFGDVLVLSDVGADGAATAQGTLQMWVVMGDAGISVDVMAAGDINGDGVTDLVVGGDNPEDNDDRQTLLLLGGSHADLSVGGLGYAGEIRAPKYWLDGVSLAVGDVNGDGYGDVVVGHTSESLYGDSLIPSKGGVIGIAYGGPNGQSTTLASAWINQDSAGVPGVAERGDALGVDVAVGDVNGDGYADVVAGVPGEDFDGVTDAGSVLLLKGGAKGLSGAGSQVFSQNSAGLPGVAEAHDKFGRIVSVLGATGTDRAQAAVGDPAENAGNGAVWVLRGAAAGLTGGHTANFGSATMGAPATTAGFGTALG